MTQVVAPLYNGSTSQTTHTLTVPAGVTPAMTGLFVIGTGSSTAVTTLLARAGSTFERLDERNAVNTRVAVWVGTALTAGNTITLTLSATAAVTVAAYYQDDYGFSTGSISPAIRATSTASTVSGSLTVTSGQKVALVAVERTATAGTTVASATASGGEAVTQVVYGEGTDPAQASCYAGTFTASAAGARTATITYSNNSGNGYAALITTTASGGGGGGGGGAFTTPAQAHNIGTAGGLNHVNLGAGYVSGHVDKTENQLTAGFVDNTYYHLNADKTEVVMAVELDGGTTSANTAYPRFEYRELNAGGSGDSDTPKAAWDGSSAEHYLEFQYRVMKVPPLKPEVVVGQIHSAADDVVKMKWQGTGNTARMIFSYGDTDIYAVVGTNLSVGSLYYAKIRCINGALEIYHGDPSTPASRISDATLIQISGLYFKFGCYAQSNETKDAVSDGPVIVQIAAIPQPVIWHTGYPPPTSPVGKPTVNGGVDATATVGATFSRTATEIANGATITSRSWKIQAGPQGVGNVLDTDAVLAWTPTAAGSYTLRYSATNSAGTGTDDVVITIVDVPVDPGGGGVYPLQYPDGTPYPQIGTGATTVSVASSAALTSALSTAVAGQKITLANGTYTGAFTITGKLGSAGSGISIEAATTGAAVFASGSSLTVTDCQHVTVKGLAFSFDVAGDYVRLRGNSRYVRVTRCTFGPTSLGAGTTEAANYVYVADDVTLFRIDHNEIRYKATSGNGVRVYGNFAKVDAGQGSIAGCTYGRIDHNIFRNGGPQVGNDKEAIRYGVSTMSRTMANAVIERNYFADWVCEPELSSVKMGALRVSGNTYYRCAGGAVLRHGTDSLLTDNYVVDRNNTTASAGLESGGLRFYDAGHRVLNNYVDGTIGDGFEPALLLDTGDAEGTSTALSNHWRVIGATVSNNVIVNCNTAITVGDNYSSSPTGCTVTNNITAGIATGTPPITSVGGIQLLSSTVTGNVHYPNVGAAGLVADSDGIFRKSGFGPRMTYLKVTDAGPSGDLADIDGTGTPLGGGTSTPPVVNAGGDATLLLGSTFTRIATETGTGITNRRWTLEAGPGVDTPTSPPPTGPPLPPANIFVATTGNDSNAGTSAAAPKRTLAAGLSAASAGQVVSAAPGTYTGNFTTSKGGTAAGGYITLRSETQHAATIVGECLIQHQYFRLQNFEITGSNVTFACDVTANNTHITGNKIHGTAKSTPTSNGGSGIEIYSADGNYGPMSNVLINGNEVYDIGLAPGNNQLQQGIYFTGNGNNTCQIWNNLIYDVADFGLHGYTSGGPGITSNWHVVNNTVVSCGRGILTTGACTVRNNIAYNNLSNNYDIRAGGSISNNLAGGTGGGSGTGITGGVNPQFVNGTTSGNGDFRLQATSPALNTGTTTNAPPFDLPGIVRPQGSGIDIGAYEMPVAGGGGGGGTPAGTVLSTSATVAYTPVLVGTYTLLYSATNSFGTGENDVTVTATTGTGTPGDVQYIAQATGSGESVSPSVAAPAGVIAGNAQAALIVSVGNETISQVPSGWTLWDSATVTSAAGDPGAGMTAWLYLTTTAIGVATWTKSGTRRWAVLRQAWRGQASLGAHQVIAETSPPGRTHATPALSPLSPQSVVVGIVCNDTVNIVAGPYTMPTGWAERFNATVTSGAENISIAAADILTAAVGAALVDDTFSSYTVGVPWAEGSTVGAWNVVYTGGGSVVPVDVSGDRVLQLESAPPVGAGTSASLVRTTASNSGDAALITRVRTVAQLRPVAPNAWETAWVGWNFTQSGANNKFYYVALKTNGLELGKVDQTIAFVGGQRFLFTDATPFTLSTWYDVEVQQAGARIRVWINGTLRADFTDGPGSAGTPAWGTAGETVFTSGQAVLYHEDARIQATKVTFGPLASFMSGTFTSTLADEAAVFGFVLEGPLTSQVIGPAGLAPRTATGALAVTVAPPPSTIALAGIPSLATVGVLGLTVAPGPQTITLRGIAPT